MSGHLDGSLLLVCRKLFAQATMHHTSVVYTNVCLCELVYRVSDFNLI